jgi:hypothetical protein
MGGVGERASTPAVESAELAAPVGRALGGAPAAVLDWELRPLLGGYGSATAGVFRLAGHARSPSGAGAAPWSLILKILQPAATARASAAPDAYGYWRREARLFGSGLLDGVPSGLAAPRCYGVRRQAEEEWLWLEELTETPGAGWRAGGRWPLARYGVAARHLGRLQGAYLTDRALPDAPWLCRGKLRAWTRLYTGGVERLAAAPAGDPVRRYWPGDRYDRLLRVWAERDVFLDALDRLPQTLVHGDFKRDNLFARDGAEAPQTAAIDWANCGIGAAGVDTATLVAMSAVKPTGPDIDRLPELDALVCEAYIAGLRDVG